MQAQQLSELECQGGSRSLVCPGPLSFHGGVAGALLPANAFPCWANSPNHPVTTRTVTRSPRTPSPR